MKPVDEAVVERHLAVVEKASERDLVVGEVAERDGEQRWQSGCRRRWPPDRHDLPELLQCARPSVQAIGCDRSAGGPHETALAGADQRRRVCRNACEREVMQLVDAASAAVRTPSANPAEVHGDRRPLQAAHAPNLDHRFLAGVSRSQRRNARHVRSTRVRAVSLPRLSCAIRRKRRRSRATGSA
jgi:hypothetical protein